MTPGGRIYQLDALRGLLALGVVVYHAFPESPRWLGTWGVYAFFGISGWAMEHVYGGRLDVRAFAVARVARLAPLWIPVVLAWAVVTGSADPARLLLNVTGAFGFVTPGATAAASGGWSIGIEVVCYALFPLLTRLRLLAVAIVAALVLRGAWNGGLLVVPTAETWVHYTQVPSFLCFFLVGMLAARTIRLPQWQGRRARVATVLGDLSYGTYLLHPLVALAVGPWTLLVSPVLALALHPLEVRAGRWLRGLLLRGPESHAEIVGVGPLELSDPLVGGVRHVPLTNGGDVPRHVELRLRVSLAINGPHHPRGRGAPSMVAPSGPSKAKPTS